MERTSEAERLRKVIDELAKCRDELDALRAHLAAAHVDNAIRYATRLMPPW